MTEIVIQRGFNTGRLYTEHGQRIYYVQYDDGEVFFRDLDRLISGWLYMDNSSNIATPKWIMSRYDSGKYDFIPRNNRKFPPSTPENYDFGRGLRI